jgi:hypothetical protein
MTETRTVVTDAQRKLPPVKLPEDDSVIMKKIRAITSRGNNAEVKRQKDGTLTVLEVKKHIV